MKSKFFIIVLVVICLSCFRDELKEVKITGWNPEFAAPLINSTITAEELINNFDPEGILEVDDSGRITIVYIDTFEIISAEEIFFLAEQQILFIDTLRVDTFYFNQQPPVNSFKFKSGSLDYSAQNNQNEDVIIILKISELLKDSQNFEKQIKIKQNSSAAGTIDLSGYNVVFSESSRSLLASYDAKGENTGNNYYLNDFTLALKQLQYEELSFAPGIYSIGDYHSSLYITFFEQWKQGEVLFIEPLIEVQNKVELLQCQWKWKGIGLSISFGEYMDRRLGFSKDLIHLFWNGNAQYIDKTVILGPEINVNLYRILAFGLKQSKDNWEFGYRIKILSGLANIQATKTQATL